MSPSLRWVASMLAVWAAVAGVPAYADDPLEPIAQHLERSPVWIDPAYRSAVDADAQQALKEQIESTRVPIYVVMVPLVSGDQWNGESEQLAEAVHDRLNRDAVIITLAGDASAALDAHEWPSDLNQARYATLAVQTDPEMKDLGLRARLSRAIDIIATGEGRRAYDDAVRDSGTTDVTGPKPDQDSGPNAALVIIIGVLIAVVLAGTLVLYRTDRIPHPRIRAIRRRPADPYTFPRAVFAAARDADLAALRRRANEEVLALGQAAQNPGLDPPTETGRAHLQRALDAYSCARKVYDRADNTADLAGVLALVTTGRDALDAATDGTTDPRPLPLCFFNPLHGRASRKVRWRPVGRQKQLRIPACGTCAKAAQHRRPPEVLTIDIEGREIPYFEVPADRSVWAATGYGALSDDLVQRIERGDHDPQR